MSESPNATAGTWLSAIAVATIGIGLFMYIIMSSLAGPETRYFRLEAPGEATFDLTQTGDYMLFHEFQRTQDSQGMLRPPGASDLKIGLVREADREKIALTPYEGSNYAIRRTVGESMYAFSIDKPGAYRLTAVHPDEVSAPHTLTIGRTHGQRVLIPFLAGFAVLTITGVLVVLIIFLSARRRHAAAQEERSVH